MKRAYTISDVITSEKMNFLPGQETTAIVGLVKNYLVYVEWGCYLAEPAALRLRIKHRSSGDKFTEAKVLPSAPLATLKTKLGQKQKELLEYIASCRSITPIKITDGISKEFLDSLFKDVPKKRRMIKFFKSCFMQSLLHDQAKNCDTHVDVDDEESVCTIINKYRFNDINIDIQYRLLTSVDKYTPIDSLDTSLIDLSMMGSFLSSPTMSNVVSLAIPHDNIRLHQVGIICDDILIMVFNHSEEGKMFLEISFKG